MGFSVNRDRDDLIGDILDDKRISLKAKGLYFTMLYCNKNYFTIDEFSKTLKEGKDAIRTAMHELEDKGYVERYQDDFLFRRRT